MSYSDAGSAFIFGSLVGPKMDVLFDGAGFIFAFRVLPAIIFVTALISLLYYIGVMGLLIRILGSIFQKALNISKIESFVAVTTIFLGQNEIPAIVKPFIDRMNRNELFTAICSGMASIAGSMMIGYAGMGVPIDYLLAASLMAILAVSCLHVFLVRRRNLRKLRLKICRLAKHRQKALLKLRRTVQ